MDGQFPLPRSSYGALVRLIAAYSRLGSAVSLNEVHAAIQEMGPIALRENVLFLVATGILTPSSKKELSPVGRALANAMERDSKVLVARYWRRVINYTEFLSDLVAAVRIRNGMDLESLTSHISYSSGQPRKVQGAKTIVDILLRSSMLIVGSEGYVVSNSDYKVAGENADTELSDRGVIELSLSPPKPAVIHDASLLASKTDHSGVGVQINLNINCAAEDLDQVSIKLKKLVQELRQGKQAPDDGSKAK